MPYQNIDATVPAVDVAAIKASFDAILAKLPFLVNLSDEERKSIPRTGEGSVGYVTDALTGIQNFPAIVPASFDAAGFKKDVDLFAVLSELGVIAASVARKIDDTRMAVGEPGPELSEPTSKPDEAASEPHRRPSAPHR
jgi:hypothetical protein